jgi:hypothetical protein
MLNRTFDSSALIDRCALALHELFPTRGEQTAFRSRFAAFGAADDSLQSIATIRRGELAYDSESFIPPSTHDAKPNLFLVVGNPAPHSVAVRSMYAYEGVTGRPHRFWRVMHTNGILRFPGLEAALCSPDERMRRLYEGDYESPFNLHIVPFFSLASPASGQWSGVAGLRRLFGGSFGKLLSAELSAIRDFMVARMQPGDSIIVFQKDAYLALRPATAPDYDAVALRTTPLVGSYAPEVQLVCVPPTRLLYSKVTQAALREQMERAMAAA